jgi:hypothetical protein
MCSDVKKLGNITFKIDDGDRKRSVRLETEVIQNA